MNYVSNLVGSAVPLNTGGVGVRLTIPQGRLRRRLYFARVLTGATSWDIGWRIEFFRGQSVSFRWDFDDNNATYAFATSGDGSWLSQTAGTFGGPSYAVSGGTAGAALNYSDQNTSADNIRFKMTMDGVEYEVTCAPYGLTALADTAQLTLTRSTVAGTGYLAAYLGVFTEGNA